MTYRPEIDGIRTIAVLSVLFFHAQFEIFSGGFIGVDVFFVISGYLITSVILREISLNKFTFINFYDKRIRRIFPALFFVIFCSVPFALLLMLPSDIRGYSQTLFASTIFGSNFLFWIQSGDYFDTGSIWKPLHHTWSLAIEEQFYFFHPIFLLIITKLSFRLQKIILLIGIFLSIAICIYLLDIDSKGNFYLLPSRVWELFAGAFLAYLNIEKIKTLFSKNINDLIVIFGLILIFYAIITFDSLTPHPSLLTVIPVLGTVLIIIFGGKYGFSGFLLTNKIVVYIGLISYSLYLWHYPIFVFSRYFFLQDLTILNYFILIFITFLLSIFSYNYIEQPFRNRTKFKRKTIFTFFFILSILFLYISFIGSRTNGFEYKFKDEKLKNILIVKKTGMEDINGFHGVYPSKTSLIGDDSKTPSWALIGDSHAGSLASEMSRYLGSKNLSAIQLSQGGCGYVLGLKKSYSNPLFCEELNIEIEKIILSKEIQNIVISARYVRYLFKTGYDNGEGGKESDLEDTFYYKDRQNDDNVRIENVLKGYSNTIEKLLLSGKRIFLVYPVPEIGWDVPRQSFKSYNRKSLIDVTVSYQSYLDRSKLVIDVFNKFTSYENFIKIDPSILFCNIKTPGRCETSINDKLLYFDDDHVSNYGAQMLIDEISKNNNIINK